ncbi:SHOCT domain-containing protein [Rhodococcus sp. NCIMB 12038]|uniref:SHOCT domain-containing protein n=1 Tax=Rhodococcus sp. NCIMB 12038 TaxID=933800 RepID=UPI00117BD83E|nr:SHOCT domain-containing protein [Rhodococcus sp. NCIMB 12038]
MNIAAPSVSEKLETKWRGKLEPLLKDGEVIWGLAKATSMRPLLEGVMVTNARVAAFNFVSDKPEKVFKVEVSADDIGECTLTGMQKRDLRITTRGGETLKFGTLGGKHDPEFVVPLIERLRDFGVADDVRNQVRTLEQQQRIDDEVAHQQAVAEARQPEIESQARRARVPVVGPVMADKEWKLIEQYCREGETPWFVITTGANGLLAAFEDRLIIAKTGVIAGYMAGALGGGRVTTFPYSQITNIEFNSGWMNGVLEVLTPSYQGSGNHDYWRGSNRGRNSASDDPRTLSNCLPLLKSTYTAALPRLNELHQKIIESHQTQVTVEHVQPSAAPASTGGLVDEIERLAALRAQGLLDDAEFTAAKQAAIARHS